MRAMMKASGLSGTGTALAWRSALVGTLLPHRTAFSLPEAAALPVPRRFQPRLAAGFDEAASPDDRDRTVPRVFVEAPFGTVLALVALLAVAAILIG